MTFELQFKAVKEDAAFHKTRDSVIVSYPADWLNSMMESEFDLPDPVAKALYRAGCLDVETASIALVIEKCHDLTAARTYLPSPVYENALALQSADLMLPAVVAVSGHMPALRYIMAMECAGIAPQSIEKSSTAQEIDTQDIAAMRAFRMTELLLDNKMWQQMPMPLLEKHLERCNTLADIVRGRSSEKILRNMAFRLECDIQNITLPADRNNVSTVPSSVNIQKPANKQRFRL